MSYTCLTYGWPLLIFNSLSDCLWHFLISPIIRKDRFMLVWKLIQLPKLFLFSFFYFSIFLIVFTRPNFLRHQGGEIWPLDLRWLILLFNSTHVTLWKFCCISTGSKVINLIWQKLGLLKTIFWGWGDRPNFLRGIRVEIRPWHLSMTPPNFTLRTGWHGCHSCISLRTKVISKLSIVIFQFYTLSFEKKIRNV